MSKMAAALVTVKNTEKPKSTIDTYEKLKSAESALRKKGTDLLRQYKLEPTNKSAPFLALLNWSDIQ